MPKYHALDTGIKLCVWDPNATPKLKTEDQDHSTSSSSISAAFSRLNDSLFPKSKRKNEENFGPAIGYVVDDLDEEYFEGHEGVDFLAPGMPFYLIKAGKELFAGREEDAARHSARGFKGATLTPLPSTALPKDIYDPTSLSQLSDTDTNLSSIGAEYFTPGGGSFAAHERAAEEAENTEQPGK
jgi:hypothetical protein